MNLPLLDIQPRTLKFVVDLKKQSSCVVQLTNTTHQYVAFKVKTTSPKKYCVRPNVGVVAPKSSYEFTGRWDSLLYDVCGVGNELDDEWVLAHSNTVNTVDSVVYVIDAVIMQAFKEPPPDMVCRDKFLIQSTVVPAETTDEDITASMFSKVEGKHIEENKLRVTLESPSDSPELSPIKRTLTQEEVIEESILKDRLYSQSETVAPPEYEGEIVKEPRMVRKAADDAKELKPPIEDLYTTNDLKITKGGHDSSRTEKETEFDPVISHKDADDRRWTKSTNNLDAPMKKDMDLPGYQGFTNGITSANSLADPGESKIPKDRDVVQLQNTDAQYIKALDENKLVKDIEEMKLKVNALESTLKQADSTISKLMEERSISSQHRQSLQQELAELRTKKIVKEAHVGFPLLFVCVVAIISIVIGYCLRT